MLTAIVRGSLFQAFNTYAAHLARSTPIEYGALQKELLAYQIAINTTAAGFSEVQLLYIAGASLRHKHLP